jgi:hypothetical protein
MAQHPAGSAGDLVPEYPLGKTAHGQDKGSKGAFLKAVGAIAAVVSLLLGLNQFTGVVQQFRIHHKEFSEAMKSGDAEQLRGDYGAAFRSFKHATELDPIDRQAQANETRPPCFGWRMCTPTRVSRLPR